MARSVQEAGNVCGHVDGVFFADPPDFDDDGRFAVEAGNQITLFERVADRRRFRSAVRSGAVGAGQHDDVFEFFTPVGLALGAQQDVATFGFDRAAGHVE